MSEITTSDHPRPTIVDRHRLVKATVSAALLAFALAVLSVHQGGSLRLVSNHFVEIAAIGVLTAGCAILLAVSRRPLTGVVAATGAILGYVTLAGIPWIGGHMIHGRSDTLVHFSFVDHVVSTGQLPVDLIYPHYHTLTAVLAEILGLSVAVSMHATVVTLGVFAILAFTVLVRVLPGGTPSVRVALSVATIALLLFPFNIYHVSYYPIGLALFFLPVVLYVVVRRGWPRADEAGPSREFAVVLLLVAAALSVSHPVTFAMIVLLLGVFAGFEVLAAGRARFATLVVVLVLGFQWYWHVGVIQHSLGNAMQVFVSDRGSTTNTVSTIADLPLAEFLGMKYGKHVVLALVTLWFVYFVFVRDRDEGPSILQALVVWGVLAGLVGVGMFLATSLVGPMRVVDGSAAIWVSLIALLVCTRRYLPRANAATYAVGLVALALLVATAVVFAIPSPATYQYGWETADADADTMEWLSEYGGDRPVEAVGFHERAPLLAISWTEWPDGEFNERFSAATDRDDVVGREQPAVYTVDPFDEDSVSNAIDDQLVTVSGWNRWHAENERLVGHRDIPQIVEQFDREGVAAFARTVDRIHTNGENHVFG